MAVPKEENFVSPTPVKTTGSAPKAGAVIFVSVIKGGVVKIVARGSNQPRDLEETALLFIMQASTPYSYHGITACHSGPANKMGC